MAKDRLHELKQGYPKSGTFLDVERNGKSDDNKSLKRTFERAEVVGQWIEQIEKNVHDLKTYLQRIDDIKHNQQDLHDKIRSIFLNNTSIAQQISSKLKEVDQEIAKIKLESAEGRIKQIQYSTLKTRFQDAFLQNSKELEHYQAIQKQNIRAQLKAKGNVQVTDEELTSLLEEGKDIQVFTENIISETQDAKRLLADVEERHQQLLQIEKMLIDVRDLFIQISILVDNQQDLINRIEYQANTASDFVENGAVELGTARKKKKKNLKWKIYGGVALTILAIIIIVALIKG